MTAEIVEGRSSAWTRVSGLRYRNELIAIAVLVALVPLMPLLSSDGPSGIPLGVAASGFVPGAALAMQAIAVVLVYRSNRFINIGQFYLGFIGASVFVLSSQYLPLYRWINSACPACIGTEATHTQYLVNYWLSVGAGLALSVVAALVMYIVVVKRFDAMPRLIVMVASIFIAPAAIAIVGLLRNTLTTAAEREDSLLAVTSPLPSSYTVYIGKVAFTTTDLMTIGLAVAAVVALFLYLRFSPMGIAMRASAENTARAELLGIDVNRVHLRVWFIVGVLAGVAALLEPMGDRPVLYETVSVDSAIRVLLVAVIARFASLPLAGLAALVLGVLETAAIWSFNGSNAPFNGALVIAVAALLLLRSREKASRAELLDLSGWQSAREIRPVPRELRDLPSVRRWLRTLTICGVSLVFGLPWVLSPAQTNLAAIAFIFGIIGLSLLVLTGWGGQISLGQFAFAAIGAYVVAVWDAPFLITLPVGALAGTVVAFAVGIPALRLRGLYLAISTLALAVSVTTVLISPRYLGEHLPDTLTRPVVLGMNLEDQRTFYYFTLGALVLVVLGVLGLRRSRTARVLIAARDNEEAVQSFGVSLVRARLMAFSISGFLAALAGGLYAFHQHGVPSESFNEQQSLTMFTMAVVGGLGSVSGPLIGATYQGILLVFHTSPAVTAFFLGFGGLSLLLLAPGGLSQVIFGLRDAMLRRIASRNRIIVPSLVADRATDRDDGRPPLSPYVDRVSGNSYVPRRYALEGQWAIAPEVQTSAPTETFQGLSHADG